MIDSIKGNLKSKIPTTAIIEVGGISFIVTIPFSTFDQLPEIGKSVELLTYLNVREDALELYGFYTDEERDLFKMLIGINKIGPKLAINILSGTNPEDFKKRIIAGDVGSLKALPGIGAKTAQRIIIELKEKFVVTDDDDIVSILGTIKSTEFDEAIKALTGLGYSRGEAFRTLSEMKRKNEFKGELETIIKRALLDLSR